MDTRRGESHMKMLVVTRSSINQELVSHTVFITKCHYFQAVISVFGSISAALSSPVASPERRLNLRLFCFVIQVSDEICREKSKGARCANGLQRLQLFIDYLLSMTYIKKPTKKSTQSDFSPTTKTPIVISAIQFMAL